MGGAPDGPARRHGAARAAGSSGPSGTCSAAGAAVSARARGSRSPEGSVAEFRAAVSLRRGGAPRRDRVPALDLALTGTARGDCRPDSGDAGRGRHGCAAAKRLGRAVGGPDDGAADSRARRSRRCGRRCHADRGDGSRTDPWAPGSRDPEAGGSDGRASADRRAGCREYECRSTRRPRARS